MNVFIPVHQIISDSKTNPLPKPISNYRSHIFSYFCNYISHQHGIPVIPYKSYFISNISSLSDSSLVFCEIVSISIDSISPDVWSTISFNVSLSSSPILYAEIFCGDILSCFLNNSLFVFIDSNMIFNRRWLYQQIRWRKNIWAVSCHQKFTVAEHPMKFLRIFFRLYFFRMPEKPVKVIKEEHSSSQCFIGPSWWIISLCIIPSPLRQKTPLPKILILRNLRF